MSINPYTGRANDPGPLFATIRPPARTTDPDTSKESAQRLQASGRLNLQCAETLRVLREYVQHWGEAPTTAELAGGDPGLVHLFSRRLPELRELGLVSNPAKRICRKTGNRCMTWEPTDNH